MTRAQLVLVPRSPVTNLPCDDMVLQSFRCLIMFLTVLNIFVHTTLDIIILLNALDIFIIILFVIYHKLRHSPQYRAGYEAMYDM